MKKEGYEGYEKGQGYESLYDKLYDKAYAAANADERLADICNALDSICELLEKLFEVVKEKEAEEKKEGKEEEAGFRLAKIGADIGEEKGQMDVIARIFGNQ